LPVRPLLPTGEDYSRWINPDWEFFERQRTSTPAGTHVRARYVVLETGDALQRLLTRYMGDSEIVATSTLKEALTEVTRVPSQALLVNGSSVSRALEQVRSSALLPSGTPAIICSIPAAESASAQLGVAARLVKPIRREDLMATLGGLGLEGGVILIVDDEPDALQLFGRMLSSVEPPYRVLLARDGQEALSVMEEHRPDAILLDLVMPNMDGFQFLERRADRPDIQDIPIVIISARDPAGQPIVSHALAVTQGGGISARQLLLNIRTISRILSAVNLSAYEELPGNRAG
jgi:CheY-like chemotaxis protein